jgi:osmotically-inducible protein OsmY
MIDAVSFYRRIVAVVAMVVLAAGALGGCAGVVIGGGGAVGTAAYQERGVRGVARDLATATKLRTKLLDAGEAYITGIGIEVYEGRVLLTGTLEKEPMRAAAVKRAWKTEGAKDVINEIEIGQSSLRDIARDSWITAQLKTKITFDKKILDINFSIETVNGIVYLIGIAQDQGELDRILTHGRGIDYVRRIISHVRVKKGRS